MSLPILGIYSCPQQISIAFAAGEATQIHIRLLCAVIPRFCSSMYSSYNNKKFSRKHELTTTSVDSRDINPQDSDRRPSKASLVLGTVVSSFCALH